MDEPLHVFPDKLFLSFSQTAWPQSRS